MRKTQEYCNKKQTSKNHVSNYIKGLTTKMSFKNEKWKETSIVIYNSNGKEQKL